MPSHPFTTPVFSISPLLVCLSGIVPAIPHYPHVDDCNLCLNCTADAAGNDDPPPTPSASKAAAGGAAADPLDDPSLPRGMRVSAYRITHNDKVPKATLPNCTVCRGCNTRLTYMTSQTKFLNRTFINNKIKLIDNEVALQSTWKRCGFNSILLPTTQKQEILRLCIKFVHKLPKEHARTGHANPQLLLDYRCYLPDGRQEMGTEYPPQVHQCLQAIAKKTIPQVKQHYGFLEDLEAINLHTRATDMLNRGYEWTLKYGSPVNPNGQRYRMQPKCCKIRHHKHRYECEHQWEPRLELPIGDPVSGLEWKKDHADIGTYVGGIFEDESKA